MATAWLCSVIVGMLAGRTYGGHPSLLVLSSPPVALLHLLLAALAVRAARESAPLVARWRLAMAVGGLLWGFGHAAPPVVERVSVTVLRANTPDTRAGPVLAVAEASSGVGTAARVSTATPRLVELRAPRLVGAVGMAYPRPGQALTGSTRVLYRAGSEPSMEESLWLSLVSRGRSFVERATSSIPRLQRAWLRGLVAGDGGDIPRRVRDAFLATGIFHLLVVSGLHVTAVAFFATALARLPFQLLYAARIMSPVAFRRLSLVVALAGSAGAVLYVGVSGLSAASQRAVLIYLSAEASRSLFGCPPLARRLTLVACAQLALFPIGFLSVGTLMSWGAYLLLITARGRSARHAVLLQARLLVLTGAVLGELPLLGLVTNLILVPAFPVVLALALAQTVLPFLGAAAPALAIHRIFVDWTIAFAGLAERFPWLYRAAEAWGAPVRPGLILVAAVLVLNALREVTIRGYDAEGSRPRHSPREVS